MSPGMPWSHSMGVPPVRWVPELSGAANPAWAITYSVRPEQSKPIWVPAGVVLGAAVGGAGFAVVTAENRALLLLPSVIFGPPGMIVGRFGGCDRAAFASAGPACRAAVTHPTRRLAVR